jgi:hypothetical protein
VFKEMADSGQTSVGFVLDESSLIVEVDNMEWSIREFCVVLVGPVIEECIYVASEKVASLRETVLGGGSSH